MNDIKQLQYKKRTQCDILNLNSSLHNHNIKQHKIIHKTKIKLQYLIIFCIIYTISQNEKQKIINTQYKKN